MLYIYMYTYIYICTYIYMHINLSVRIHPKNPRQSHVQVVRQFPLKLLQPQNPPNRETQISRYLEVQIQIEIWLD